MNEGMKQIVRETIIKVRDDLISGKIPPHRFCMIDWFRRTAHCGSVGCIGGWAQQYLLLDGYPAAAEFVDNGVILAKTDSPDDLFATSLHNLFYSFTGRDTSIPNTVAAINRWLAGDPDPWDKGERLSHRAGDVEPEVEEEFA